MLIPFPTFLTLELNLFEANIQSMILSLVRSGLLILSLFAVTIILLHSGFPCRLRVSSGTCHREATFSHPSQNRMAAKTAFIVGAKQGIGLELGKKFKDRGYEVYGTIRSFAKDEGQLGPVSSGICFEVMLDFWIRRANISKAE